MASVATAAGQPGVSVVSMSWGFPEGQAVLASDEAAYDNVFNMPGVTFVASTGDYGTADPEYPAFSPDVVAVGGTSLMLNPDGSYNSETGWGYQSDSAGTVIASGGGLSLYEPEPAYQQSIQSTGSRTTPDLSFVADPVTGAWIADPYNLDPSDPFEIVGGTSLSAPAWAGLLALVDQGRAAAGEPALNSSSPIDTQQALYMLPQSDYNVIASGTNGYSAGAGYNLVTGLGTPVASLLVPDLVAYHGSSTSYAGPTVAPLQNVGSVNPGGTSDGGPTDVFSVFDALTLTGDAAGYAQPQVLGAGHGSPPSDTLAPASPGRNSASPAIAAVISSGPTTSLAATMMPSSPAAVGLPLVSVRVAAQQPGWLTSRSGVNNPSIPRHSVALQRTDRGLSAPSSARIRGMRLADSVLDELASDTRLVRWWTARASLVPAILPWDGVITGAPMAISPSRFAAGSQLGFAIPAGNMSTPETEAGAPQRLAAPEASLADILVAAGLFSFGALVGNARRRTGLRSSTRLPGGRHPR